MLSAKQFCVTATTVVVALSFVAGPAHADAHHDPVWTGTYDNHGAQIFYVENKNNAASGSDKADVFISAWNTGTGTIELLPPPEIYGTMIWSLRPSPALDPIFGDPACGGLPWCWRMDAANAAGIGAEARAFEGGKPCGWVLWYAWDGSKGPITGNYGSPNPGHNPLFSGTFC